MNSTESERTAAADVRAKDWVALIEKSRDRAAAFPGKECNPAAERPGQRPGVDIAVSERELEYIERLIEPKTEAGFVAEEVAELQGFGISRRFSGTEISLLYRRRIYVQIQDGKVTRTTNCFQSMIARVATI